MDNIYVMDKVRYQYRNLIGINGTNSADIVLGVAEILSLCGYCVSVVDLSSKNEIFRYLNNDLLSTMKWHDIRISTSINISHSKKIDYCIVYGDYGVDDIFTKCKKIVCVYDYLNTMKYEIKNFLKPLRVRYRICLRNVPTDAMGLLCVENMLDTIAYNGCEKIVLNSSPDDNAALFKFRNYGVYDLHYYSTMYINGLINICCIVCDEQLDKAVIDKAILNTILGV